MKAVFIATMLPVQGPTIISLSPDDYLSNKEKEEVALSSMPVGGKEGEFCSVALNNYHTCCILTVLPPIDEELDSRDTPTSIGFLLDPYENPIPYKKLIEDFIEKCKTHGIFTLDFLKKALPELFKLQNSNSINIHYGKSSSFDISITER